MDLSPVIWIWIHTLQGPFLAIFATELGERNANKTFTIFLMLVWWHESRYETNYSHFFRGGWRGVLTWCNVRAHKITISVSSIDFRATLTTSADLRQQHLTSFCAVYGVFFDYKRKSTVVSSGVRDVTLVTNICYQSAECLHANFCNQTWYCGASRWAGMSCEKTGILSSRSRSQCGLI